MDTITFILLYITMGEAQKKIIDKEYSEAEKQEVDTKIKQEVDAKI